MGLASPLSHLVNWNISFSTDPVFVRSTNWFKFSRPNTEVSGK